MKRVMCTMLAFAAVAMSVLFVGCAKDSTTRPLESDVVVYFDGKQALDKSGLMEQILPMTGLMSEAISMEVKPEDKEFVKSLVDDLDNTGITFSKPFYMNMDLDELGEPERMAVIAKVHNAANMDRLMQLLEMECKKVGEERFFEMDNVLVGYNNQRLAAVATINPYEGEKYLKYLLSSLDEDLSVFGKRDLGLYVDAHAFVGLIKSANMSQIETLEYYGYTEEVEALKAQNLQFDEYVATMAPDAHVVAGLTFDPGRIVFDMDVVGIPNNNDISKQVNNEHLNSIPDTAWLVANMGVNGEALAAQLPTMFTAELLDVEEAEFGMIMAIATEIVKGFAGDVTIALNSFKENYYGAVVDAIAMIDVNDTYMIDNVGLVAPFAGVGLQSDGKNKYSFDIDRSNTGYLGQKDGTFYVGVNSEFEKISASAVKARWFADVKNSYGYMVVDAKNLVQEFRSDIIDEGGYELMEVVGMLDYAYISCPTTKSFEFALVLNDKNTNALAQIVNVASGIYGEDFSEGLLEGMEEMADEFDIEYDDYDATYDGYYEEELTDEEIEELLSAFDEEELEAALEEFEAAVEEMSPEELELMMEMLESLDDYE